MPSVTIIIPYKNTADYLRVLLDSIFRHELPFDAQVIVVNDHSTENCEEYRSVMQDYDTRVEFYANAPGVTTAGAARNTGLLHAKGEWLLFADADDYFLDGWEIIVGRHLNDTEDIIYFIPTSKDENGREHTRHLYILDRMAPYLHDPNPKNELILRYCVPAPWSKLIRHSIVRENNIRFDEVMYGNDVMFSTKCAFYAREISLCNDLIYCVLHHETSLTTNKEFQAVYTREKVFCDQYNFCKKNLSAREFRYTTLKQKAKYRIVPIFFSILNGNLDLRSFRQFIKLHKDNKVPYVPNLLYFLRKKLVSTIPEPVRIRLRNIKRLLSRNA